MINKFIKIHGVGKFANFNAKGDVLFAKNNIIYAENGYGKTTLGISFKLLSDFKK